MLKIGLCVIALLAVTPCYVQAGPVYKIVGPDGKITFSDTPAPPAHDGSARVVHGESAAPPAYDDIRVAEAPSAAVEAAVIGALSIEDIVQRTATLCAETLPTSAREYSAAVAAWRSRNGAVAAQARQSLEQEFSAAARAALEAAIRTNNDGLFTPVATAAAAVRISWCEQSFATLNDGTMDVHANAKVATPLSSGR